MDVDHTGVTFSPAELDALVAALTKAAQRTHDTDTAALAVTLKLVRQDLAECLREQSETVTVKDYARATGTPERTVRHWCQHNQLPASKLGGKAWAIALSGQIAKANASTPMIHR